ncbi:ESX-1 secretion-associated protein [Gandjariella thermophila]|uniref:ESX-1 secretion-associated protein n=1 Tax=Gandjariella thermophila TaxID=1931992 RepID=A0A4D4JES1_9PSEU|nr:ESX-1 secretion-associated protein [Gandjariella thermophila]GDY32866.1 hypothetical protein GTS_44990 [Gandjariella thermophila]
MTNGYDVSAAELASHARQAGDVAERVGRANGAAQQVGLGGVGMYGLLCSPVLIPALHAFFGDCDDLLKNAADLGHACAEGIQHTQRNYEQVERDVAEMLGKIK